MYLKSSESVARKARALKNEYVALIIEKAPTPHCRKVRKKKHTVVHVTNRVGTKAF